MFYPTDYNLFFELIQNYSGSGFRKLDNQDLFMVRLNCSLNRSNQFFYLADLMRLRLLYTSPQVFDILGVEPKKYDLSYNFMYTHPAEIKRRSVVRAGVIETGQELYIKKSGNVVVSSNFNVKKTSGEYVNLLVQCLLFYINPPIDTVYILQVNTQLDGFSKRIKKGHYQWYAGGDLHYFRYPDEELLQIGSSLSDREREVVKCIQEGMSTKDIGRKLFLSPHTIYTHRRNILKKTGKSSLAEVIHDLDHIGILS